MLKRLWVLFAQVITICLAVFFVIKSVRPDLLDNNKPQVTTTILQSNANVGKQPSILTYRGGANKAMPSVVNIFTHSKVNRKLQTQQLDPLFEFFFRDRNLQPEEDMEKSSKNVDSLGSGVIVTSDGYILTNNHVINGADTIEVALHDGRTVNAKIIGTDPESDLAVLKINLTKLPAITFAGGYNIEVGDVVLAIGNPFGVGQTITMGIISALKRNHLGINTFENFIQTDAAINPGNSGGALVDSNGNLIGINTAIFSKSGGNQGIGFAIPVLTAKQVMEQLINNGEVVRGWIGIIPRNIDQTVIDALGLKSNTGAFISKVMENGPAQKAGLKAGDIITKIGGKDIQDTASLLNTVAQIKPNTTVECTVLRQQQIISVKITIGKRPNLQAKQEPLE
ncbi:MAG: Trypsin-like serine protease, typically periplasmic, contains C-terminal domain [Pseudomonadota bacterium]|jgi:serine protease DegQ